MEIQVYKNQFGREARNRMDVVSDVSFKGARAALESFYYAFNHQSIDVFKKVWLNHPLVQLNNPLGGIMRGMEDISNLYENIFNGSAQVWVEFYDIAEYLDNHFAVFAGKERGEFMIGNTTISLDIRTTRCFVFSEEQKGWCQIHHHGSIDDPNLLKQYQSAIKIN